MIFRKDLYLIGVEISYKNMAGASSPMDQFKITKIFDINIFGLDLSITNSAIMMLVIVGVIIGFLTVLTNTLTLIPGKKQVIAEAFFNFICGMMKNNISHKSALKFFPLVFSVFMFILFANALGVIPYTFTITSHISVTFCIALIVFLTTVIVGIKSKGLKGYFSHFIPEGIPIFLAPLMFVIEFFTYLIRPITLAVRLAANMIAGHTILKVIAGFVSGMAFFGFVPVIFISALIGFEFFVAGLQAYIFTMLTCIYINEAVSHH